MAAINSISIGIAFKVNVFPFNYVRLTFCVEGKFVTATFYEDGKFDIDVY